MSSQPQQADKACPSARAEPGNLLYGRVNGGVVERLGMPLVVDQSFIDSVSVNGPPEQRFRFAGQCLESGCGQWTGTTCGVIERVLAELAPDAGPAPLPRCAIRPTCRWYDQEGPAACGACTHVITDRREPINA